MVVNTNRLNLFVMEEGAEKRSPIVKRHDRKLLLLYYTSLWSFSIFLFSLGSDLSFSFSVYLSCFPTVVLSARFRGRAFGFVFSLPHCIWFNPTYRERKLYNIGINTKNS